MMMKVPEVEGKKGGGLVMMVTVRAVGGEVAVKLKGCDV